ncbi:MAG TPA: hypothetical protein VG722_13730, partial [Tepidisphaeraceae bacterium]|nr:hypothetical protein [Tepidisphaeraceae bacterium]
PDGTNVETVDERNDYYHGIDTPNVAFSFSPVGRAYILHQLEIKERRHDGTGPDVAASFILYAEDGPIAPIPADTNHQFILGHDDATVLRQKPWFVCLSAYRAPIMKDRIDARWVQDRQNFISIFHDGVGLIVGGGNTKLTPLWSTFTAGDTKLLSHHPGETKPDYAEPKGLLHVPTKLKLDPQNLALLATYGKAQCQAAVKLENATTAKISYSLLNQSRLAVEAHVTLIANIGGAWHTESGEHGKLGPEPIHLTALQAGGKFYHNGWSITLPTDATLDWPVLPYDQYVKDGTAPLDQGRIVVTLPLGRAPAQKSVQVQVGE